MGLDPSGGDNLSTAPQFANSTPNLAGQRMSTSQVPTKNGRQVSGGGVGNGQQSRVGAVGQPSAAQQPAVEPKEGFMQKMLKMLCCG